MTSIRPEPFPSKSFPFYQLSRRPTLCSLDAESVVRYLMKIEFEVEESLKFISQYAKHEGSQ
jgi:hypothetical protein